MPLSRTGDIQAETLYCVDRGSMGPVAHKKKIEVKCDHINNNWLLTIFSDAIKKGITKWKIRSDIPIGCCIPKNVFHCNLVSSKCLPLFTFLTFFSLWILTKMCKDVQKLKVSTHSAEFLRLAL